jgi:hypothetical protein
LEQGGCLKDHYLCEWSSTQIAKLVPNEKDYERGRMSPIVNIG